MLDGVGQAWQRGEWQLLVQSLCLKKHCFPCFAGEVIEIVFVYRDRALTIEATTLKPSVIQSVLHPQSAVGGVSDEITSWQLQQQKAFQMPPMMRSDYEYPHFGGNSAPFASLQGVGAMSSAYVGPGQNPIGYQSPLGYSASLPGAAQVRELPFVNPLQHAQFYPQYEPVGPLHYNSSAGRPMSYGGGSRVAPVVAAYRQVQQARKVLLAQQHHVLAQQQLQEDHARFDPGNHMLPTGSSGGMSFPSMPTRPG